MSSSAARIRAELPRRVKAVVIGGGIAGTAALDRLVELGCDSVLLEKGELTCGSTWHAAGLCTQYNSSRAATELLIRSLDAYENLNGPEGSDVGLRRVGSVRLAFSSDQVDEFTTTAAVAHDLGLPFELVDPARAGGLFPLAQMDDVLAAAYLPTDGYIDPTLATQALAARARERGAKIHQRTRVIGLAPTMSGWRVTTERGELDCDLVLNAAGQWARQIGLLAGADLPIVPLQHHYVITEQCAELDGRELELPVLRDPRGSYYVRQEGGAMLVGPFETDALTWAVHHVPDDFEGRLLPGRLEHILPVLNAAARRIPVLEDLGLKSIINGPDGYTPDGRCLMGEVPGMPGFHVLAGFSIFGIVFGAGAGAQAAEWMLDGHPGGGLDDFDVGRFSGAPQRRTAERAREVYSAEYAISFPEVPHTATRPLRTDALYDFLAARGARYGAASDWERPLWFARDGGADASPSFRFPGWHAAVGEECRRVRSAVGIVDNCALAKFEISGDGVRRFFERRFDGPIPAEGEVSRAVGCSRSGAILGEFDIAWMGPDRYLAVSTRADEARDTALFLPRPPGLRVENVTATLACLTITGPATDELLGKLVKADPPSTASFPIETALVRTSAVRVSAFGEPTVHLLLPMEYARALYSEALREGEELGIVEAGAFACDSLSLEAGIPRPGAGLADPGEQAKLVALAIGNGDAPAYARAGNPVWFENRIVSRLAAGGYGHCIERPVGLAYLPAELAAVADGLQVEMVGHRVAAGPLNVTIAA